MIASRLRLIAAIAGVTALGVVHAVDPPESIVNPRSGTIETADSFWAAGNYDVRHTVSSGPGQPPSSSVLSTDSANDLDPRIAWAAGGDLWVVWWRESAGASRVVVRHRAFSTGTWDAERLLGEASESARKPRVAHDGSHPWAAFEAAAGSSTSVIVQIIIDGPDPIPTRTIVGSSTLAGGPDIQIHAESGRLWVDWVDDDSFVAWSEYDPVSGTWSAEAHESYASDSVPAARARVKAVVVSG